MRTNNKGFTLTELLVSVVIFGVVLAAAFGFMLASAKSYNRVNDRIEIQTKSQMALNLIQEYVIDSVGGIYFEGNTLYILREPTTKEVAGEQKTTCDVDIFRLDSTNSILEYAKTTATQGTIGDDGIIPYTATIPTEFYEVAKKVGSFNVPDYSANDIKYLVNIKIGMKNRSTTEEMNIALRNKPPQIKVLPEE